MVKLHAVRLHAVCRARLLCYVGHDTVREEDGSTEGPARPRRRDVLGGAALAGALALALALQIHRLDDPDTWWHLATGRLVWSTGSVPRADPFSYTAPGASWLNRQWLFELALYASWLVAGPAGPSLFAGGLFAAAFALLARLLRRTLPRWATAVVVAAAVLVAVERFTVRPEAVTCCLLAAVLVLVAGRIEWRTVLALVGLQVVWANCHALSVLGLVPIGAALAAALAARLVPLPAGWRVANARGPDETLRLGVAFTGAALAEAATPFGVAGAVYPLWLLSLIGGKQLLSFTIVEHRATALAELSPVAGAAAIFLLALGALALVASMKRLRLDHALVAIAFTTLAVLARRNVALAGFGVAPLVASGLGPMVARADQWLAMRPRTRAPLLATLVLAVSVAGARVVTGTFYDDAHLTRTFGLGESWLLYPARAVDFLEANAPTARVLNDDVLGGYLLWRGYPGRRVFFDGRLQVYPESVYLDWQRLLDDPRAFPEVAARWGTTAVILHHPAPGRLELARAIAQTPGWRVAYLDGGGVVLLADGLPHTVPAGMTDRIEAFSAPGIAAPLEHLVTPLRFRSEVARAHYQRGRAIHYLFGPAGYPFARHDFESTLRLEPGNAEAARGLAVARERS